jgi:hypothetical protein
MNSRARPLIGLLAGATLAASAASPLHAQDTSRVATDTVIPPHPPAAAAPLPFDFSGVLYLNFQQGGNPAQRRNSFNRFNVDRAYLNFRGAAGNRMSYRVTADVFQQADSTKNSFYPGWIFRAKYAYGQYDYIRGPGSAFKANVRLGMLPTPYVEYEEQYWIRGLSQTALELNGYVKSSDLGAASVVTFPNKYGEVFAAVLNGPGYSTGESDRFKDWGGHVSVFPLVGGHSVFKSLNITPWYYHGDTASRYLGGAGTVQSVFAGRARNRYGVFLGLKDPRVIVGTQFSRREDALESADTTVQTAPTVITRRGGLFSGYVIAKPLAFVARAPDWPIITLVRIDYVKANIDAPGYNTFIIGGLGYDLNKKASIYLDYQNLDPHSGSTSAALRTLFVHAIINF